MWRWVAVALLAAFAFPAAADDKPQGPTPGVYKVCRSPEAKGGEPCATPPKLIHNVWPDYSEAARKARVQGKVLLALTVDKEGVPHDVEVVDSLRPDLDEKAMEAVRQWRFEPGRYEDHPVAVKLQIEVTFRLR